MDNKILVIFDFETGDLFSKTCPVMQLTVRDHANHGKVLLSEYVVPFEGSVVTETAIKINGITEQVLKDNNAIKEPELCELILHVMRTNFGRKSICWIGYNSFKFDQLVMEALFKRTNFRMPDYWYFMDVLPLCRHRFRITPDYKQATVHSKLVVRKADAEPIQWHDALGDTLCLHELVNECRYICDDDIIQQYTRPKTDSMHTMNMKLNSKTFLGYYDSMNFDKFGYGTVGSLFKKYRQCKGNANMFIDFLMNDLGVYKKSVARGITNQLERINNTFIPTNE